MSKLDRYTLFLSLLSMTSEDYKVTDAKMKDYSDRIMIAAECEGGSFKIEVTLNETDIPEDS